MRPLCGIQHGGNRKSQGALARLCEFPGISPPKSPKNPISLIETSRDTLHPGTGVTARTNRPAGRVRGLGLRGNGSMLLARNQVTLRSLILVFYRFAIWGTRELRWGCRPKPCLRGIPPQTPFFASRRLKTENTKGSSRLTVCSLLLSLD